MGKYTKYDTGIYKGTEVESVPVVAAKGFPKDYFENMYRAPFGSDSRWYFRAGEQEFYSGLTGPIGSFMDKSFLAKASKKMALEGVDSDDVWGERANYGSCVHLLVALHERGELVFKFNDDEWLEVMEDFLQDYGYQHLRSQWQEDIQNDMAMWFQFKKDHKVKVMATELMVRYEPWRIATPLDIICGMDFGGGRILANVNLKTGDKQFGDSYYVQACMEAFMYNEMMPLEKWKLKGSFCLRPKSRKTNVGDFELSKNCINLYTKEYMDYIGQGCILREQYKPKGHVKRFSGEDGRFTAEKITPYQWLSEFS